MKFLHRLLLVLAIAGLTVLPTAQAITCTDPTIPPSNPDSIYADHGDGTVSDTRSGLIWKRCAEGQNWSGGTCSGSATSYTWSAALSRAATSVFAGYSNWRLPNINELRSLVEVCRTDPALNDTVFPATPISYFWSGSPYADGSYGAWVVNFGLGVDGNGLRKYGDFQVRLVRGGQSFDSFDGLAPGTAQSITFGLAPSILVGGTGTVSAAASSGLPVTFSSQTASICSVLGSTVSGLAVGTCSIAASQAGNTTYSPAQALQSFSILSSSRIFPLSVSKTGSGSGDVTSNPAGIDCGATCSAGFNTGQSVSLSAAPASGSRFVGWGGACTGAEACAVTMDAAKNVTARFDRILPDQTITFGLAPALIVGGTGSLSATASSGYPVIFSSTTPRICSVAGSTVSGLVAGTCVIAANQPGDSNFNPAAQVMQSIVVIQLRNRLQNPGFEGGATAWSQYSSGGFPLISKDSSRPAHAGAWYAWLGGYFSGADLIQQSLTIPADAASAAVEFWVRIATQESSSSQAYDWLTVDLLDATGAKLKSLVSLSNLNANGGQWFKSAAIDVSAYKGQRVMLRFAATTNASNPTDFFIDDVSVMTPAPSAGKGLTPILMLLLD
jgi:hypothetical protein